MNDEGKVLNSLHVKDIKIYNNVEKAAYSPRRDLNS